MLASIWDIVPTTTNPCIIHLIASNDRNGNPRRLFLTYEGEGLRAWDEGYAGYMALPDHLQSTYLDSPLPSIPITGKTYRDLLRAYR